MFLVMVSPMAPEGHGIVILSTERATNIQLLVDTPATWEPLEWLAILLVHVPYKFAIRICTAEGTAFLFEAIAKSLQKILICSPIRKHWKSIQNQLHSNGCRRAIRMRLPKL